MDKARAFVNDSFPGLVNGVLTPGAGRILTNDAAFTLPYLNEAFSKLQRKLRTEGVTFPDKTVILNNLTALAQSDPSVAVYVGYNGYFNGFQMSPVPMLPGDLLQPYFLEEQTVGTNVPFVPMAQPQEGVQSCIQGQRLGVWQWKGYRIYMPGSLVAKNIRVTYKCGQPPLDVAPSDFSTAVVNILDSESALAYYVAEQYALARGGADPEKMAAGAEDAINDMVQEWVRRGQSVTYRRQPYHGSNTGGSTTGSVGEGQ
jgi:hypothetical protein